jgi:hypothetical protein
VKVYEQDALGLRALQKWAARFRTGQEDVNDNDRSGGPPQTDICDLILRFLETKPHSSSRDVTETSFLPKTLILRVLADLGFKCYKARWIPHWLSWQKKADRGTLPRTGFISIEFPPQGQKYDLQFFC